MIATVAAVANLPYEAAAELCPREPGTTGFYPHEIRKLLQDATQIEWRSPKVLYFRRLRSFCNSDDTLVLIIRQPGIALLQAFTGKKQHCICVRGGRVFDPEYRDAIRADDYERIRWPPTIAFYPVDGGQLREIQESNHARYRNARLWSEIIGG